eukprot:3246012-Rhodomonas_salina.1
MGWAVGGRVVAELRGGMAGHFRGGACASASAQQVSAPDGEVCTAKRGVEEEEDARQGERRKMREEREAEDTVEDVLRRRAGGPRGQHQLWRGTACAVLCWFSEHVWRWLLGVARWEWCCMTDAGPCD